MKQVFNKTHNTKNQTETANSSEPSVTASPTTSSGDRESVVLFGEALADIFPDRRVWGGAPLNVARHLHAFGAQATLITCLGLDALGDALLQTMAANGMETVGIQRTELYQTGRVEVAITDGGHRFTILPDQAYDHIDVEAARTVFRSARPQLLYFGSLAQRCEASSKALGQLLEEQEVLKFFDINLRNPWYRTETLEHSLRCADILKLNSDELELVADMFGLQAEQPEQRLVALMNRYQLSQIVLTRGEEGAWLLTGDKMLHKVGRSSAPGPFVDTVGAGDAFSSICILGIMGGWPFHQTLAKANEFASAVCGIRGALPEDHQFYQRYRQTWTL